MNYPVLKKAKWLLSQEFLQVRAKGRCYKGKWIVLIICKNNLKCTRLGITVSKRFGKAVFRNRFKRIVRETFRKVYHQLPDNLDIQIKPKKQALQAKPQDIEEDLSQFFSHS